MIRTIACTGSVDRPNKLQGQNECFALCPQTFAPFWSMMHMLANMKHIRICSMPFGMKTHDKKGTLLQPEAAWLNHELPGPRKQVVNWVSRGLWQGPWHLRHLRGSCLPLHPQDPKSHHTLVYGANGRRQSPPSCLLVLDRDLRRQQLVLQRRHVCHP